jgi:hypothetical protein
MMFEFQKSLKLYKKQKQIQDLNLPLLSRLLSVEFLNPACRFCIADFAKIATGLNRQLPGRNFHPLAPYTFVAHLDIVVFQFRGKL